MSRDDVADCLFVVQSGYALNRNLHVVMPGKWFGEDSLYAYRYGEQASLFEKHEGGEDRNALLGTAAKKALGGGDHSLVHVQKPQSSVHQSNVQNPHLSNTSEGGWGTGRLWSPNPKSYTLNWLWQFSKRFDVDLSPVHDLLELDLLG